MATSNGETLSQVLASMLRVYFPAQQQKDEAELADVEAEPADVEAEPADVIERSPLRQFGLFWLGAMVFLYPLFLAKILWNFNKLYSGGWLELTLLSFIGLVPCAVLAGFIGWLLTTGKKTKRSRVRLFLTGLLLPYLVAFLLSRLM